MNGTSREAGTEMEITAKDNLLRVIRHDHPRWVPYGLENTIMVAPPLLTAPGPDGLDSWGVRWEQDVGGRYPASGGYVVTDIRAWREQVRFPDLDALDWSHLTLGWGGLGKPVSVSSIDRTENLVCGVLELSLFERSYLLMGMEEALVNYVQETGLMDNFLEAITDFNIALIQRFDDVADLDMLWYGDDWGTQQGLFLPPDVWRSTVGKHTQRVYDGLKQRGILINQHSCGKIESVFGDLVEMGADIWNPCQPCNDLAQLKRAFSGRVTFCGGIDSQFVLDRPNVTPEEVRSEVRRRIDELAGGGGYIAGPSHGVAYRPDIIEAMKDEIHTYGRSFYRT